MIKWLVGTFPFPTNEIDIDVTGDISLVAGNDIDIDADGDLTLGGAAIALTADGGALSLNGDGTNDIDISNALAAIDIDSNDLAINVTNNLTLDAAAALALGGASIALTADGGILSLTGDGTNDIDIINAGANIDIDSDGFVVDTTDNLRLDADADLILGGATVSVTADGGIFNIVGDGTNNINITNTGAEIDIDSATLVIDTTSTINIAAVGGINIELLPSIEDVTTSGVVTRGTVTPAGTFGQCLCLDASSNYVLSDADSVDTVPGVALVIDTGAGANKLLLNQGLVRDDTWSWTPKALLFVSDSAGAMTHTAPTTTGQYVQAVGYAVTATIVYFNPALYFHKVA